MPRSLRPYHVLIGLAAVVFLVVLAAIYLVPRLSLTPVASFGAPLRAGEQVYLLTGQWRSVMTVSRRSSGRSTTDLLVDLWAFDATTLKPVYRRRIQTLRNGAMLGRSILGAQNQTLWVLLPTGLHALNRQTGAILASPARLGELNPGLRELLPTEPQFYQFSNKGLSVKTADARTWYLHPDTFSAAPEPHPVTTPSLFPAYFTPQATYAFLERGYPLGSKWLGLLTPEEVVTFGKHHDIGGLDYQSRRRLYAADITQQPTFFGPKPRYSNFQPLTEDFLAPGILAEHRPTGHHALIYRRAPDSIFVLYLDRLGENGRLQLARVTGPAGKLLWKAPLPLSVLQSVLPHEQSLVLYGRLYRPQDPNAPVHTDPMHSAREMLVSVNWTTGAVVYQDQSDTAKHPEAAPQ